LDDYANVADAFIALYEVTFNEEWLIQAKSWPIMPCCIIIMKQGGVFYYTADNDDHADSPKI
jgi:uncharacterized protein YyaL (SSP411 family)